MDDNECQTVLAAARASTGKLTAEILADLEASVAEFTANVVSRFSRKVE